MGSFFFLVKFLHYTEHLVGDNPILAGFIENRCREREKELGGCAIILVGIKALLAAQASIVACYLGEFPSSTHRRGIRHGMEKDRPVKKYAGIYG
jgi:hypothetical protein